MNAEIQDAVTLARDAELHAPSCKCGKPCEFYSPHAGYSVQCQKCNEHSRALRRNSWALHAAATNKRRRARAKQKRAGR